MSVRIIFIVIACFLCPICLCGQASNSLKDELLKVEYLLRSGELKLADELASQILLKESKAADVEQFYKLLCLTYKVKRGFEELTGTPTVYNFLNEEIDDNRKEKGLIITYFKIKALREYYLDCLNETDPWIKNKDDAFKGRVLALIEQISEKAINRRAYGRYSLSDYSTVFSYREETFKLNSFIADKVYEEVTSFYLDALRVELKEQSLDIALAENGFSFTSPISDKDGFETRLIEGLNTVMGRRKRMLSKTGRADLFPYYKQTVGLSLASHISFQGLDAFMESILLGAEQKLADFLTLEYISWITKKGESSKSYTPEKILQWCNRAIINYPRTHLIHNNSLILKYQLEEKSLEIKGSAVLYPYQDQKLEIRSRNIDTLYYILCKNPFGYNSEFKNLVQRKQKNALKQLVDANQILKGQVSIGSPKVGVEQEFELEMLGQASAAYCLFAGTQEDIFEGAYTLYEFNVARSAALEYINEKGQVLKYDYNTSDFSAISESSLKDVSPILTKSDTIVLFEKPAVMVNKHDTVKLSTYLMSFSDQTGLELGVDYQVGSSLYNKPIMISTRGKKNSRGQLETQFYSDTGRFYPFEFNLADSFNYANSIVFNNWINNQLPKEFVEVNYKQSSAGIDLNAYSYDLSDTLSCTIELNEVMPVQIMLFLDGKMLKLLSPADLKNWRLPIAGNLAYGMHMLELFYISESKPKFYYAPFFVQDEQDELKLELSLEEESKSGVSLSGSLSKARNSYLLISGKPKPVSSDMEYSGPLFSTKVIGVHFQATYESLFNRSLGLQFAGVDPSKYLRMQFPVVNKFKEYDSGVFDYKVNSKGRFVGAMIESNTDLNKSDSANELTQWGYDLLKVVPFDKSHDLEKGVFAVVYVDHMGRFGLNMPENIAGDWEFNLLYIDEQGALKGEKYSLELKN